jgi:hypothetical protein
MIKSRRMRWVRHTAHMGEMRKVYKTLVAEAFCEKMNQTKKCEKVNRDKEIPAQLQSIWFTLSHLNDKHNMLPKQLYQKYMLKQACTHFLEEK